MIFNEVFSEDASQEQVFAQCGVSGLVLRALEGYSTTVFAFGQTGSGKVDQLANKNRRLRLLDHQRKLNAQTISRAFHRPLV